ncbi:MAG: P-II family nitrogen regulator [Prosthecochloris sp.]|uniref:Nitrogen regulatory protein P-II n=1 Tax=Prosthecochloris aestuarii (strain DSM 271 / SK 413) TaxID=290512 RepID=B4S395_PROA2|nr:MULTISPECIES: P-II family nitrogen regulator [Prosthecochloris]ACF45189.1 nitrogen regulatory protein P-II [Prosthecochloris aestuarii DSM 271]MCW8798826.1 P-II family nitrogen regulator [Prosthecochloris sp.]NEX12338.1 P-II family nitrogen regulator [Prosthecochloris sp.]RDD31154.1 P-II family nitrogen regulator [Prosthecochloris sp. ZM]
MKLITAIIQEDKLDQVREALIQANISRISVSRISGHGRQEDIDIYRGRKIAPNLRPKIKLEIAVNEEFVDVAIDTIVDSARHGSGEIGDGKIFVTPLEQCVRIRTNERGGSAI